MTRSITVLVPLVYLFACSLVLSQDVAELKKEVLVGTLEAKARSLIQPRIDAKTTIRYTLGNRANGDRLVASSSVSQQWTQPQDVSQTLTYPKSGTGAVITYIEIVVDQSSSYGRGYILNGGVGQRSFSISIEALQTTSFRQSVLVYGY